MISLQKMYRSPSQRHKGCLPHPSSIIRKPLGPSSPKMRRKKNPPGRESSVVPVHAPLCGASISASYIYLPIPISLYIQPFVSHIHTHVHIHIMSVASLSAPKRACPRALSLLIAGTDWQRAQHRRRWRRRRRNHRAQGDHRPRERQSTHRPRRWDSSGLRHTVRVLRQ